MKKLYIIRHGQTAYNQKGVLQGRTIDAQLNKTGKAQARAFYEYYAKEEFDLILTSELKRSIQSVEDFVQKGIPHLIDERITEFSWGENEGMPLSELVIDKYKAMLESWNQGYFDARIPGGESGKELIDRVSSFVKYLLKREEEKILICTHGRTLKMLIVTLMNWEIREMENVPHSNAALYLLEQNSHGLELIKSNDTTHFNKDQLKSTFWDR